MSLDTTFIWKGYKQIEVADKFGGSVEQTGTEDDVYEGDWANEGYDMN